MGQQLLIVGCRNSAVEAAIRCHRAGARVSLSYRRAELDSSISGGLQGKRAFLGGDIKLSMSAIGSGTQFSSFMKFGRDYSYPPIIAFLLLRGGTQAERVTLARRALRYRVYPVVISVL